ncbi:DUF6193 family natural product biosynthesis protein [Streptomyces vinaceus]|uniref:DUF6193 family natural product biosynthesis protein n=1 Tax=Streptomyces vinaceus TaxID=1960 RepID=UPI0035DB9FF6
MYGVRLGRSLCSGSTGDVIETATGFLPPRWHRCRAAGCRHPGMAPFAELVVAAHAEPLLRQLYPWTGMWELHFSRCTEARHTWDIPSRLDQADADGVAGEFEAVA